MLREHRLDFHSTFRRLAYFKPSTLRAKTEDGRNSDLDAYISSLVALTTEAQMQDGLKAAADWKRWLEVYGARIESERAAWGDEANTAFEAAREKAMRAANPRFVLRQWVLEEVIRKVADEPSSGKRVLRKVLQVRLSVCVVVAVHNATHWCCSGLF